MEHPEVATAMTTPGEIFDSMPRFYFSDPYSREEHRSIALPYPAKLRASIIAVTEARIEGKELNKRRPAVKLHMALDEYEIEIAPRLTSSATGWEISPIIPVMIMEISNPRQRLNAKLKADDKLGLARWFRDPALSAVLLQNMDTGLTLLSQNLSQAFSPRRGGCGMCGRHMTDPLSQERGIGPECWEPYGRVLRAIERSMEAA